MGYNVAGVFGLLQSACKSIGATIKRNDNLVMSSYAYIISRNDGVRLYVLIHDVDATTNTYNVDFSYSFLEMCSLTLCRKT